MSRTSMRSKRRAFTTGRHRWKPGFALIRKSRWSAPHSAGQAAVYLASQGAKVYMLVRRSDLSETMSRYLVDRISSLANIEVVTGATISSLEGRDGVLDAVRWRQRGTGQEVRRAINHLFLFIGADPTTDWLKGSEIALDEKGFILTGAEAGAGRHMLETARSGVFAIGDVRAKSVKRVAAAVGEGAQVVAALHSYLASAEPNLAGYSVQDRAADSGAARIFARLKSAAGLANFVSPSAVLSPANLARAVIEQGRPPFQKVGLLNRIFASVFGGADDALTPRYAKGRCHMSTSTGGGELRP